MYYLMYINRDKGQIRIQIDRDRCTDCGHCLRTCKKEVFLCRDGKVFVENEDGCIGCRKCMEVCVYNALDIFIERVGRKQAMKICIPTNENHL